MKIECAYDELVDVDSIVENPKNNNRHSVEQIQRLAKIIKFQGQRSPLVISKRSGFLIKGHCRLAAIKLLGWEKVAVDFQDYENEAQEYADMTADNEISRWSEFDYFKFKEDWNEIKNELDVHEFDFELFGIETKIGSWSDDLDDIKKIEDKIDPILGKILIKCPMQIKIDVLNFIKEKLKEASFEGIEIE